MQSQVRFNRVPKKVPEIVQREALVRCQSLEKFAAAHGRAAPHTSEHAIYIKGCVCMYIFLSSLLLSFFDRGRCALRGAGRGGAA